MRNCIDSKLGFGPMSAEIIEGIVKASADLKKAFMLISTKNQIDWDGGYVSNWKTIDYVEYIDRLTRKYPASKVYLCRDHCGPGFKNNSIDDVYKTIYDDIENGFELIHLDFSKVSSDKEVVLKETQKAILAILKKSESIHIEIGTEENVGDLKTDITQIKREFNFINGFVKPEFFVVQTGSLTKEVNQIGALNKSFIKEVHGFLTENGVKLKEHNADYLDADAIEERRGLIDALNIAPQLGVLQTITVISEALTYGVDINSFLNVAYESEAWGKWLYKNTPSNKMLCSIIAGHYNFTKDHYRRLADSLERFIDIKSLIIEKIKKLVTYYSESFY